MERLDIFPNSEADFDRLVHESAPDHGDAKIASKARATKGGKPGVVIAFTADVNGKPVPVQTVVTLDLLEGAVRILRGVHAGDNN